MLLVLGVVAAHYAPLFEKDRTWTYELSITDFDYVDNPDGTVRAVPGTPVISTFTCKVTSATVTAKRAEATIECDREIDSDYAFRVDGEWIATAKGLYRGEASGAPVIAAAPRVKRTRTKDYFGGYLIRAVTSPKAGTSCGVTDTTQMGAGDGAIETMCFRAGAGIVSGKLDYHGGTPRIVEYKLR